MINDNLLIAVCCEFSAAYCRSVITHVQMVIYLIVVFNCRLLSAIMMFKYRVGTKDDIEE